MTSLTLAKSIADNPRAYSLDQLRGARDYLAPLLCNGGVINSERATRKLSLRLLAIDTEIRERLRREDGYVTDDDLQKMRERAKGSKTT